jgi:hypothetical protein
MIVQDRHGPRYPRWKKECRFYVHSLKMRPRKCRLVIFHFSSSLQDWTERAIKQARKPKTQKRATGNIKLAELSIGRFGGPFMEW